MLFVGYLLFDGYSIKNEIDDNGIFSIGKYISHKRSPKVEENFVIYYINGQKYRANGGRAPKGFNENIGKFYQIKFAIKNKNHAQAFFDKEITDTVAILEAGFSREEIER